MELVRKLQQSFYKDDDAESNQQELESSEISNSDVGTTRPASSTRIIRDLPLWRVQWTELPGSQNVLNVHVAHYTNMFQKILKGRTKRWGEFDRNGVGDTANDDNADDNDYDDDDNEDHDNEDHDDDDNDDDNADDDDGPFYFGHIFLKGGSENLDNPDYALQEGDVGVLMRISDSRQLMQDGRLTLVVQALERFRIHRVVRPHSPYAIADVEVVVDSEQVASAAAQAATASVSVSESVNDTIDQSVCAETAEDSAVNRALAWHPFEYRRVLMDECELARDATGSVAGVAISPLSNYDAAATTGNSPEVGCPDAERAREENLVAIAERNTWLKLDQLLNLLSVASQGEVGVPVPTQILGLLPRAGCALGSEEGESSLITEPWPEDFFLERAVAKMEAATARSTSGSVVGTHSTSPFVRVDAGDSDGDSGLARYSPLRRAQRLSYVIWTLAESIDLDRSGNSSDQGRYDRETLLRIDSTEQRLALAIEKMDLICALLRQIIRMQGPR